jgi:hypothetical protein
MVPVYTLAQVREIRDALIAWAHRNRQAPPKTD